MPTLPTRDDIRAPQARPSTSVIDYRIPTGDPLGASLRGVGDVIAREAAVEKEKLDRLKVEDKITQLMQAEIQLSQEYEGVKGAGVVDKTFHEGSTSKYKSQIDALGSDLTPEQRSIFETTAKRRAAQFDAGRYNYAARETESYYTNQNAARLQTWQDSAAANYTDPSKLQEAALGSRIDAAKELARKGYTDPNDPVVKTKLAEVEATLWGRVLDRALTNDDAQGAKQIYASAKGLLTDEQRRSFEQRIKPANDFAEGQQLALAASKMLGEGKTMAEIELEITKKASSPGAYTAAQTIFTNMQQAHKVQEAETRGTVLEAFARQGGGPRAMASVLSSPEYGKLTEAQQGEISNYMRENARQAVVQARQDVSWQQQQADRLKAKQKEAQDFKGLDTFISTLEDPRFSEMSRAEIYALAPTIGTGNVTRLLSEQTSRKTAAGSFKIDKDILDAAIPEKLLEKGNKDKLNAFRGFVEVTLQDWKAANPGKMPDLNTQRKIANSANTKWVEIKNFWPDAEHAAFEGPPDKWVERLQAAAAKKGKQLSPEQVDKAWRAQSLQGQ